MEGKLCVWYHDAVDSAPTTHGLPQADVWPVTKGLQHLLEDLDLG